MPTGPGSSPNFARYFKMFPTALDATFDTFSRGFDTTDEPGYSLHPPGDWYNFTGVVQNPYNSTCGFDDVEAVYGPEPHGGPTGTTSAIPTHFFSLPVPTIACEDTQPCVMPTYDTGGEWPSPIPIVAEPTVYHPPPALWWDVQPSAPVPFFYPECTSSGSYTGTTVPIAPVPPSSGPQRIGKRNISLSPAQVGNFKQRLRKARPPGGYKSETAIATTHNIIKDGLPDADIEFSTRPYLNGELYLEDVLKQHLGANNKIDMYQKLATMLRDMDIVNPSPALRTRPVKTQGRPSGKTEASVRKAEASEQRRRNERTVLEFVSQRFRLPAGKKHFSKTEVLSLALAHLITKAGSGETSST